MYLDSRAPFKFFTKYWTYTHLSTFKVGRNCILSLSQWPGQKTLLYWILLYWILMVSPKFKLPIYKCLPPIQKCTDNNTYKFLLLVMGTGQHRTITNLHHNLKCISVTYKNNISLSFYYFTLLSLLSPQDKFFVMLGQGARKMSSQSRTINLFLAQSFRCFFVYNITTNL